MNTKLNIVNYYCYYFIFNSYYDRELLQVGVYIIIWIQRAVKKNID